MLKLGSKTKVLAAGFIALVSVGAVACKPLPPAPPGGKAADCSDIAWGSTEKTASRMITEDVTEVRAGRNHCFDRLVVEIDGPFGPGWYVRYSPLESPGTGDVVPLRGTDLEVIVLAPGYDNDGVKPPYDPGDENEVVDVSEFDTFRQVAYAGSFEGQSHFGIGVRARLPFRVFAIESPDGSRLVIDVAHNWA